MSRKKKIIKGRTPNNPIAETDVRRNLMDRAKAMGCDFELRAIFEKYDKVLKNCTNEAELQHIQAMGASEIHKLFGLKTELVVGGRLIIPAEPGYENVGGGKITKL